MPPKKANIANGDGGDAGGKFSWEGANDTKLLILTQGRYVKPEEYAQLSSVFPGTTTGSIRNRISGLRVKQRNMYEEFGWDVPEGGAGQSGKKGKKEGARAKKRGAEDEELDTPTKKPPAKKVKEAITEEVKEDVGDEHEYVKVVKQEKFEEDEI